MIRKGQKANVVYCRQAKCFYPVPAATKTPQKVWLKNVSGTERVVLPAAVSEALAKNGREAEVLQAVTKKAQIGKVKMEIPTRARESRLKLQESAAQKVSENITLGSLFTGNRFL